MRQPTTTKKMFDPRGKEIQVSGAPSSASAKRKFAHPNKETVQSPVDTSEPRSLGRLRFKAFYEDMTYSFSFELSVTMTPLEVVIDDQRALAVVISLRSGEPIKIVVSTLQSAEERTFRAIDDLMSDWGIPRSVHFDQSYLELPGIIAWLHLRGIDCIIRPRPLLPSASKNWAAWPAILIAQKEVLLREHYKTRLRKVK